MASVEDALSDLVAPSLLCRRHLLPSPGAAANRWPFGGVRQLSAMSCRSIWATKIVNNLSYRSCKRGRLRSLAVGQTQC